ncbi:MULTISPECIES: acyl-CoA dehydrogenase family protein [Hydrogenophaga]|uniref:Acyl-CoA dehydrogenase n=1 Tax=Hydrogenophaga intermedia TaxID=65786 RepID=A0A1L1PLF4_HYDIT|nr:MULTISPECIES: acyl-CoA dehydrogenase family protein [Hydrogenophaga]AOS81081.1 acyl-CoA dehydrogenase [Hydrogenophaga sp. PBC]TMU71415.1 acyl-CoA dehydrogenase [Hydrogenophaga intermedia]CDN90190.1 Acyl-CoA dehydrogenase [Hydrogenophaga intermedia]
MTEFEFLEPDFLDEDLRMVRDQVRRFSKERIVPFADAWEASGEIPRSLFRELGELGFLGMRHPVEYGGGGLGALSSVVLGEELARSGYGGVASALTVHSDMSISHIAHRGSHEQKQKYLPDACAGRKVGAVCVTEPGAGSDVAGLRTRAVRTADGGWLLSGSKTFITNGVHGDIYIVAARTDPEAKGSRGISMFIVDKDNPGLKITRQFEKHGWRSSDTAELFFDDLKLPADALLGEEGKGFYYIVSTFQNERLVVGALVSGTCARAIELTVDYVRQRQAFGKSLWDQQVVRNKLAWMASKAAAVRALTYQCAQMIDEGKDTVREVSMLKAFGAETLQEVVHTCLQLHGGTGFIIGTPVERMARDARILTIGGGATEVMLEEVAKRM